MQTKPLTIIGFRAENTKRIKAIEIYPDKPVVLLTGKNRQGKTSVLDAIWMALGGKKDIPDKPIKTGKDAAEIHLDLGEFSVTRKITKKGNSLKVCSKGGASVPSPQKFLDSCLTGLSGNPLEFMRMKPKDQAKVIQKMFPLQVDKSRVEGIAGLLAKTVEMEDDPGLYLNNVRKMIFDERTETNREIKRLKGAIESFEIPPHLKGKEPIPQEKLSAELKALQDQDKENERTRAKLREISFVYQSIKDSIPAKEKEISDVLDEIARLQHKLSVLRSEKEAIENDLSIKEVDLIDAEEKVNAIEEINFSDINERIAINQTLLSRQKLIEDLAELEKDSDDLTRQLNDLDAYKVEVIKQAKLPLTALGFGENGELTYNCLPLEQASGREQIEISCAICLAQHPQIGVLTVDVGWSELDSDGKEVIRNFARQTGAQIWVTQVMEEPGSEGFHIVDGELMAVDGVPIEEDVA